MAKAMKCDPDLCPNCQYIGDGDSLCDVTQEIVLSDWTPTENFMGEGCPYRNPNKVRPHKKKGKKKR